MPDNLSLQPHTLFHIGYLDSYSNFDLTQRSKIIIETLTY